LQTQGFIEPDVCRRYHIGRSGAARGQPSLVAAWTGRSAAAAMRGGGPTLARRGRAPARFCARREPYFNSKQSVESPTSPMFTIFVTDRLNVDGKVTVIAGTEGDAP
jgi:hypothetical protein